MPEFHARLRSTLLAALSRGDAQAGESAPARELIEQFDKAAAALERRSAKLHAREATLRMITDNLPAMIGYWDRNLRNRFANADYRRWFGKTPKQIHGRHITELLGPELYAKNKPYIDAVLTGRRQDFDRTIPGPDGTLRYSQASYIPHLNGGEVAGFFVLVTDVSERVRAEQALSQMVKDRETLLKEVYHRVKNNLQVVQSLLRLQVRTVSDAAAQEALLESAQRVRSMVLVHEQLYRSESLSQVALPRYVDDLLRQLLMGSGLSPGQVSVRSNVKPASIGPDLAIPLGLLLSELVTNSLKHAFPEGRCGEIAVEMQDAADGRALLISVTDNGRGLPPGFDPAATRSMGLQLAMALAQQLGGSLHFDGDAGTRAWLIVPAP
jgi:PAS domain S-box-containing protein